MVYIIGRENFYFGASEEIIRRARVLRKTMTIPEEKLWNYLRRKQLMALRFRRQHPINRFIVDFYCHAFKLVIEIDGSIHQKEIQQERDENRTYELQAIGLTVIRFTNNEIMTNIAKVIKEIEMHISKISSTSSKPSFL
ncbi:MAG: endonuclease domain-containing protein [Bacteroidota bacterium]